MFSNNPKEKVKPEEVATNSSSIIGKGTSVEGDLNTAGNIRIEGDVKGNVSCQSKIALGQSSYVEGTVLAQNAEIAGEIQGSIEVADLLILRPTAVIHGDIVTNKLIVESGATFNGSCRMGVSVSEIDLEKDERKEGNKPKSETERSEETQSRTA
ncbi:MAG: polymer-forming cytoskeletal protein [Cyclobacteriaceae bacterium]